MYREEESSGLTVVDYKTNRVDSSSVPQLAEEYRLQLSIYALAVERAIGTRPDSLVLHFVRPGVDQTLSWDDAERSRAINEVEDAIASARVDWAQGVHREATHQIA